MFAVVLFNDFDDSPAVVPCSWLSSDETSCVFPPGKATLLQVKRQEQPKLSWVTYTVRKLGVYETYEKAQKKCRRAEDTSNLSSEGDVSAPKRQRIIKTPFSPVSHSSAKSSAKCTTIPYPLPVNTTMGMAGSERNHLELSDCESEEEISSSSDVPPPVPAHSAPVRSAPAHSAPARSAQPASITSAVPDAKLDIHCSEVYSGNEGGDEEYESFNSGNSFLLLL